MKYATGDVVEVFTSECPGCGFKGYRGKVIGRCDDMITVKGVNVFGGAIIQTMREFIPRVTGHMRTHQRRSKSPGNFAQTADRVCHRDENKLEELG